MFSKILCNPSVNSVKHTQPVLRSFATDNTPKEYDTEIFSGYD